MERDKTKSRIICLPFASASFACQQVGNIFKEEETSLRGVFCERPLPAGTGPPTPNDNERRR